jgi:NodT family efflux transporter outer membrane factor (OMF) lipoprotein
LNACASEQQANVPSSYSALPVAWSTEKFALGSSSSELSSWWTRFEDNVLNQLMTQAMNANTSVIVARAALKQAQALRGVADAALAPTLSYSAAAQRNTAGINPSISTNNYRTGIDGSWELDLFGAKQNALDASDASVQASAASLGVVKGAIAVEVALGYISLRSAQARLAIANDNLTSQLKTLQITQWRQQAGLIGAIEVAQARGASEQTRAQVPVLQVGIEKARHALALLSGQAPLALMALLDNVRPIPQAQDDPGLGVPESTLRKRPDVRVAQQEVTKATALLAQANAQTAPVFKLGGTLGFNALTAETLARSDAAISGVSISVALPLLDGGAAKARIQVQQAALEQSKAAYQATVLAAIKDVEDALLALRNDRERLAYLRTASEAAANAAQWARQRYASGLVDFQVVLETQRNQLATQDNVASSSAELSADQVRLYAALGGGWNPDIPEFLAP